MKMTILENVNGNRPVILTEGCHIDGVKIAGIFSSEDDARSIDADQLALGTVAWDKLTMHQQEVATENTESL